MIILVDCDLGEIAYVINMLNMTEVKAPNAVASSVS